MNLSVFQLGVISHTLSSFRILCLKCNVSEVNKIRQGEMTPSTIRLHGPKAERNKFLANNVRKISWPFVFSFAMDIDQTDEDDRGWVRLTAIFNIFKILTSKILKKIRVNQTPTLFNKRHRRPNILFIYFHTRCFDIMVQFT